MGEYIKENGGKQYWGRQRGKRGERGGKQAGRGARVVVRSGRDTQCVWGAAESGQGEEKCEKRK